MAWGGNTFVADGGGYLWHSADGITWRQGTARPQRVTDGEWFDGIMWNGTRFIGWGLDNSEDSRYGFVWHSVDGLTWTEATIEGLSKELAISGVAGDTTRLVAVTNFGTFLTSP